MTQRFPFSASLLLAALLVSACGKKPDPRPAESSAPNPPAPKPQPQYPPLQDKLLGKWERTTQDADDSLLAMEFRADGAAVLTHRNFDGKERLDEGKLKAPAVTGAGPYHIQVTVPNGLYGMLVDVKGDELVVIRTGDKRLTFRKVK